MKSSPMLSAGRSGTTLGYGGLAAITRKVSDLYRGSSHFDRNFVRGKLMTDPASLAVLRLAAERQGFGVVSDLGCGFGQVGLALLLLKLADEVHGLDLAAQKIRTAAEDAAGLRATFTGADVAASEIPACDTVTIFDVLLQVPEESQLGLLRRIAAAARRRVVIRAFDLDRGWRTRVGFVAEEIGRAVRRDGTPLCPRPLPAIAEPFEAAGFSVTVRPCWGWTPLPNVMLVAERAV